MMKMKRITGGVIEGLLRGFRGGDGIIKLTQIRGSNPSVLIILDGVHEKKVRFLILHSVSDNIETFLQHVKDNEDLCGS